MIRCGVKTATTLGADGGTTSGPHLRSCRTITVGEAMQQALVLNRVHLLIL